MCDSCGMDEDVDDSSGTGGVNWSTIGISRMNWTDPVIIIAGLIEMTGNLIQQTGALAGGMLRAHSNHIGQRQQFRASAGQEIERMTAGVLDE